MNLLLFFGLNFWGYDAALFIMIGAIIILAAYAVFFICIGQFVGIIDLIGAIIMFVVFWNLGFPLHAFVIWRFCLTLIITVLSVFEGEFTSVPIVIAELIGMILILVNY